MKRLWLHRLQHRVMRSRRCVTWSPLCMALWRDIGPLPDHVKPGHEHFYPWSEVKAERHGGPRPTCRFCGEQAA